MADEKDVSEATPEATPETEGQPEGQEETRTYSQEEFQSELDRRITAAVAKRDQEAEARQAQALEEERERLKQEQLKEQGKYKELHENSQAELDALKAKVAMAEERDAIHKALSEAGLSDYEDILTSAKKGPNDFVKAAESLRDMVKNLADAEVEKRLETPPKPKGGGDPQDKGDVIKALYSMDKSA